MKVFLSWSGDRSRQVALALRDWLPRVVQRVVPFMSQEDIAKGTRPMTVLANELAGSEFGVICLTPENLGAPWLNYEAGAISKTLEGAKVCPFLVGIRHSDLSGPLAQFQATEANPEEVLRLLKSINASCGAAALEEPILEESFEKWWPDLKTTFAKIPADKGSDAKPRKDRELLEEILDLTRSLARDREKAQTYSSIPEPSWWVPPLSDQQRRRKTAITRSEALKFRRGLLDALPTAEAHLTEHPDDTGALIRVNQLKTLLASMNSIINKREGPEEDEVPPAEVS